MLSQIICSVFPGDKKKKKIWRQKPQAQTSKTVSVECDLKFLVRKSNLIYCNTHTSTPKPKVLTPEATPWSILSPPSPGQAPGAGLSRQHRAPICASHRTVLDKSLQVGRGATSAPPARAPPPPPGWPPVSGVPLTCRRSVAGCHIFQPLGLAEETLGDSVDCAWGRGAAAPLYIWGWCPRGERPGAGHRRRAGARGCAQEEAAPRSAAGNLWARARAAVLAQLREDCAAPPGPERTAAAAAAAPSPAPHRRCSRTCALSMPGAGALAAAGTPAPRGSGGATAAAPRSRPEPRPRSPREPWVGWGLGDGADWPGREGPGELSFPKKDTVTPSRSRGSQASGQQGSLSRL